jgi:hypothetical protein
MVTTFIILIATCSCINCIIVWLYIVVELGCLFLQVCITQLFCYCKPSYEKADRGSRWSDNADPPVLENYVYIHECVCVYACAGASVHKAAQTIYSTMYITLMHTHNTQI